MRYPKQSSVSASKHSKIRPITSQVSFRNSKLLLKRVLDLACYTNYMSVPAGTNVSVLNVMNDQSLKNLFDKIRLEEKTTCLQSATKGIVYMTTNYMAALINISTKIVKALNLLQL